jgi:hypothetical protein
MKDLATKLKFFKRKKVKLDLIFIGTVIGKKSTTSIQVIKKL